MNSVAKSLEWTPLPPVLRLLNRMTPLMKVLMGAKLSLQMQDILDDATKKTGLEDFGEESFREPLEQLLSALREEGELNFMGYMGTRERLRTLLSNRLSVVRDQKAEPDIRKQKITAPIFILGLPRTGTSILYYLFAQDPHLLSPTHWKMMFPSPPPELEVDISTDPRCIEAQKRLNSLFRFRPEFRAIHDLKVELPNECILFKDLNFTSIAFPTAYHLPTYQKWLLTCSQKHTYEWHKRCLQQLQYRTELKQWVLKSPDHLVSIKDLFKVYPDARIIQTHRDPMKVIPSYSSLNFALTSLSSHRTTSDQVGRAMADLWHHGLQNTHVFRQEHPELAERFIDVRFEEVCDDLMGLVERLYKRLGLDFTEDIRLRMNQFIEDNPRNKHGKHRYSLEQFGLDEAKESRRFSWYEPYWKS